MDSGIVNDDVDLAKVGSVERSSGMTLWAWDKKNLPSIMHTIRTAVAATASVIVARLVQMPEAYWAAIATLVVMQGTLGATLTLSLDRIVATAWGRQLERSR